MIKVYIIFGDHSEKIADYLSETFEVIGFSRTLDGACAAELQNKPDVFLVLGSAMVTGVINGVINHNTVLLKHLKKIRLSYPESIIKILLSEKVDQSLVEGIVALGIYDIHKFNKVNIEVLPQIIQASKTIADYEKSIQFKNAPEKTEKSKVEIIEKEEEKPFFQRIKDKLINKSAQLIPGKEQNSTPGEQFIYEACPYDSLAQLHTENNYRQELEPPQIEPIPKKIESEPSPCEPKAPEAEKVVLSRPKVNAKIISITAPWASGGGVTMTTSILAGALAGRGAAVDCDIYRGGLAVRMGLKIIENDWRQGDPPVMLPSGIMIYPIDPAISANTNESALKSLLSEAGTGSDWLLLDAGSNPQAWWFECLAEWSSLVIWVVRDDPLLLCQAGSRWPGRPDVSCREIMVLYGSGDIKVIEDAFTLPCVQLKGAGDKKGIKALADLIAAIPAGSGKRVLTVGLDSCPDSPGVVYDSFQAVDEAVSWIKHNKPDVAIALSGVDKLALLEFDLRKHGIPVYEVSDTASLLKIINNLP